MKKQPKINKKYKNIRERMGKSQLEVTFATALVRQALVDWFKVYKFIGMIKKCELEEPFFGKKKRRIFDKKYILRRKRVSNKSKKYYGFTAKPTQRVKVEFPNTNFQKINK